MVGIFLAGFGEDGAADGAGEVFASAAGIYVDGIDAYMTAVKDSQPRCHHAAVNFNVCHNGFFGYGLEHGGNDPAQGGIGGAV